MTVHTCVERDRWKAGFQGFCFAFVGFLTVNTQHRTQNSTRTHHGEITADERGRDGPEESLRLLRTHTGCFKVTCLLTHTITSLRRRRKATSHVHAYEIEESNLAFACASIKVTRDDSRARCSLPSLKWTPWKPLNVLNSVKTHK
jgi:hypothetical protein